MMAARFALGVAAGGFVAGGAKITCAPWAQKAERGGPCYRLVMAELARGLLRLARLLVLEFISQLRVFGSEQVIRRSPKKKKHSGIPTTEKWTAVCSRCQECRQIRRKN